jgi:hypothetical protein
MTGLKQAARVMDAVMAEPVFPRIASPVDVNDAEQFPEIARAIAGMDAMSPERRALLDKEWAA